MSYTGQSDNDVKEFTKRLPVLKMSEINSTFYEMLPLCGLGPAIAFSRFLTLNNKVVYGVHALTNAYRRAHKDLWGNKLNDALWIRCMYFENAIEAYNKVVDYIYIILYFNFELYEKLDNLAIKTKEEIICISQKIGGKEKLGKIDKWLHFNEITADFAHEFNAYKMFIREMRDLANDIKHRGCIAVEDATLSRCTKVTRTIDGQNIDITELASEIKINLEIEIEKIVEIHRHTLEIQQSIYKLCNFQSKLKDFLNKNI